jgi:Ca-activated chloride channel family protein
VSAWFHRPEALAALLAVPLAWWALRAGGRAQARRLAGLWGRRVGAAAGVRRGASGLLFPAGVLLGVVALLGPAVGAPVAARAARGADVVLCLDVSRSMHARDIAPDRLARAKQEAAALADRAPDGRLGLVAFAGTARLLAPLTRDGLSFRALLAQADTTAVDRGGTDLAAALDVARGALAARRPDAGEVPAIVVLLTDGEDHEGRGLEAARRLAARGIVVHAVGFGTPRGGKIAMPPGGGEMARPGEDGENWLRDRAGRDVVSALHEEDLRRIAEATGGTVRRARAGEDALRRVVEDHVRPGALAAAAGGGARRRPDRYAWPWLAALLLFLLDLAVLPSGGRR